jgi:hypothetical protein
MANLLISVVVAAALVSGQAAAKPNFTGEWTMNAARSNFGAFPAPTTLTRTIKHDEPSITIIEHQVAAMGEQSATRKYVTDGTPTTFEAQGTTVPTSAKWAENALLVVSSVEALGMSFNDRMTLSADGKTMTSVVRISSPQGEVEMTVVFDRAK